MFQQILIGILFIVAVGYLGRLLYRSFQARHACASGCGKCGSTDLEKIDGPVQSGV
jgi:hypothetical protein